MHARGWWNPQMEDDLRKAYRKEAVACLNKASTAGKPKVVKLFDDVYDEHNWILEAQHQELVQHMARYEEHYQEYPR